MRITTKPTWWKYANPGRLWRVDLASGAKTALLGNLQNAIGLLVSADRAYAYVSEQTTGRTAAA